MSARKAKLTISRWRFAVLLAGLLLLPLVAVWHIAGLQVMPDANRGYEFLQDQAAARTVRTTSIPAYRGVITDRHGTPLAVSTPVVSLYINPQEFRGDHSGLQQLANGLDIQAAQLKQKLERYSGKEFMYLARHLAPDQAEQLLALKIPGVYARNEYKRFYPAGEVTAQLVGFTNIDDQGQEGMELAFNDRLTGVPGAKKILKDLKGRVIKDLSLVRAEKPGQDLALSIDLRLQYAAYRELKAAVARHGASSGTMVVLDAKTGEVLAMANQPSFNPNDRSNLDTDAMRNRAVIDLLEPGSLVKPLTIAAALESGKFDPHTPVDTSPGWLRVGRKTFVDPVNYGLIDLTSILTKSSQVGTTKVALALEPDHVRDVFQRVGFGDSPGTGFPGESPGSLPQYRDWKPVARANFAFGYGLSATALQLAQAYSVLASDGIRKPVSLLRGYRPYPEERVMDKGVARQIRGMLKTVTHQGGTGTRAAVAGYEVAGKTGTVHLVGAGGYEEHRYRALFAGMAPADDPSLVAVVVISDPRGKEYFGGQVAGPIFGNVMADALRILKIAPYQFVEGEMVARPGNDDGRAG